MKHDPDWAVVYSDSEELRRAFGEYPEARYRPLADRSGRTLFRQGDDSIDTVAHETGFTNVRYFNRLVSAVHRVHARPVPPALPAGRAAELVGGQDEPR